MRRSHWAELAGHHELDLSEQTLANIRSTGDPIDLDQVRQIYLPLTELVNTYIEHKSLLYREQNSFLRLSERKTTFVIGVAGSVAVGKSTTSRLLRELLRREGATVDLVTTDGFLYPNAELERRGLMDRKGFPESYDRRALVRFVRAVKSGEEGVQAPVYSHLVYDIVPGETITVNQPDILIVEGLNVLQPPRPRPDGSGALAVSDFFDFSVYVDASQRAIRAVVRRPLPPPPRDGVPRPQLVLHALRRRSPRSRPSRPPTASGTPSTAPTSCRTSSPPVAAPPSCCARVWPTTSSGYGSARSDPRLSPPPPLHPPSTTREVTTRAVGSACRSTNWPLDYAPSDDPPMGTQSAR